MICFIVRPSSISRRSFTYKQNNRGPRTEPCRTLKLVSSPSELPFLLAITIWEGPCKYDFITKEPTWRTPVDRSSFDGDTVLKALLK